MSDKRSVHTDALQTLGTIIDGSGKRDAIHLAVEPCIAGENLYPGQHIGIVEGKVTTKAVKKLGIVDPFITGFIPEGARFWLIVYPRQITSLRHVWEHPDFPEPSQVAAEKFDKDYKKAASEQWLREWCSSNDAPSYESIIYRVLRGQDDIGEHSFFVGDEESSATIPEEFWEHIENVTGIKIQERPTYFSCAC